MNWSDVVRLAFQYGPLVKEAIDEALTNHDLATKIRNVAEPVVEILTDVGNWLFPKATDEIKLVGAAITSFDFSVVRWIQRGLNSIDGNGTFSLPEKLVVDGVYGVKTRDAIETFQTTYGLVVDGVAGQVTQGALQMLLRGLSEDQVVTE